MDAVLHILCFQPLGSRQSKDEKVRPFSYCKIPLIFYGRIRRPLSKTKEHIWLYKSLSSVIRKRLKSFIASDSIDMPGRLQVL